MAPAARTSQSAFATRAAQKPTMFAMLPPLTRTPEPVVGYPMSSAIQRIVCVSISVPAGDSIHPPTLGLTAAASNSASMPIGAGEDVM